MEDKKIKIVKIQPKSQLICNIQVFLNFTNFYNRFIKNFSRIANLLILILKTIILSASGRPSHTKINQYELDTNRDGSISNSKINDKIANISK